MFMLVLLISLVLICIYWSLVITYQYWHKRGVPHPPPSLLFGNLGQTLTLKKSIGQVYTEIYNNFPNLLYVGFYKIRTPGIVLRDPSLIKDVLTKEFNNFHDNDIMIDEKYDPITGKNPFVLKGNKWRIVKNQISPCFTSKKLKAMYPLLEEAAADMINFLKNSKNTSGVSGLEAKEVSARYSTDVVASCVFGLKGNSFEEDDPEFRRMGKKIFEPSISVIIKQLLLTVLPSLGCILKVSFIPKAVVSYFQGITTQVLKYREENNIVRNDFLDFMGELKHKPGDYEFTDVDVVAHALGFFVDGFETSALSMCFVLYELAANPDVQEKLLNELKSAFQQNSNKFDYDTITGLKYLDAVVCESLRLHAPGMALTKICTKPFTLPPPKGTGMGKEVIVEVNTPIVIPVHGLHYDSKYFYDSHKFDPERFFDKNKESIIKGTYLPFGEGPRACHGQRFGMLQIKLAVANIVINFDMKLSRRTILPLEIDPAYLMPHAKGGIWLHFCERTK